MFTHMRNCHEIHGEFKLLSSLSTRFLDDLPAEPAVAVAKCRPRVLPFFIS